MKQSILEWRIATVACCVSMSVGLVLGYAIWHHPTPAPLTWTSQPTVEQVAEPNEKTVWSNYLGLIREYHLRKQWASDGEYFNGWIIPEHQQFPTKAAAESALCAQLRQRADSMCGGK